MSFNRVVNFSEAGNSGVALADALGIEADQDLELTELMSVLFDRLYRLGAVRNMDGSRARRRRGSRTTTRMIDCCCRDIICHILFSPLSLSFFSIYGTDNVVV